MIVIDPGHTYTLSNYDGLGYQILRFVKRTGEMYPGNKESYPGTLTQEVLRVLIDRTKYVDQQIPHPANKEAIRAFRSALRVFEERAAVRHGKWFRFLEGEGNDGNIEDHTPAANGHLTQFWVDYTP